MSRLLLASTAVIVALCGLIFAVGMLIAFKLQIPAQYLVPGCGAFAVVMVLVQYAAGPYVIDAVISIRWTQASELGADFDLWLHKTCATFNIPVPRFGIIEEGSPNAFTYGNGPWNARVVVTRGIIDSLEPEELKAVVAHELGHIKHRDFIVMTIVQALVLALYALYISSRFNGRRNGAYVVILSYAAYWLSYYISLVLSRVREYMADYASAQIMSSGNPLSSALVKICYGMGRFKPATPATYGAPAPAPAGASPYAGSAPPVRMSAAARYGNDAVTPELMAKLNAIQQDGQKRAGIPPVQPVVAPAQKEKMSAQALGAFGIAGLATARAAVTWQGAAGAIDPDHFTAGARWELFNPWARIAELVSTHPLTARRIMALQKLNARFKVPNAYDFSKIKPGTYTGFFGDLVAVSLPYLLAIGVFVGIVGAQYHDKTRLGPALLFAIAAYCMGCFLRLLGRYRGSFMRSRVVTCLGELNVSHVRPKAVVLQGVFTGRLSAGMAWADDFVLQDDSGFVACALHQPLQLFDWLWGWMNSQRMIGQEVVVYGWYRRFGAPYVEISHVESRSGQTVRSYYYPVAVAFSLIFAVTLGGLGAMLLQRLS